MSYFDVGGNWASVQQFFEKLFPLFKHDGAFVGESLYDELADWSGFGMIDNFVHSVWLEHVLHQLYYFRLYLVGFSVQKGSQDFGDVTSQGIVDFTIEVSQQLVDQSWNLFSLGSLDSLHLFLYHLFCLLWCFKSQILFRFVGRFLFGCLFTLLLLLLGWRFL